MKSILQKKFIIFLLLYTLVIFVSMYPVYYAHQQTPSGFFHTGQASWFDPWDINVYIATIKYAQQHRTIFLPNLYTSTVDTPALYYPFYTVIGALLPSVNTIALYNGLTIVSSYILLLTVYLIASAIFKHHGIKKSRYLFILILTVAFGRGISWLVPLEWQPADLYMTSFTFRSAFQRPHEAIAMALYIATMANFYLYLIGGRMKFYYVSLTANILLILFYPYYIVTFFLVNIFFLLFSKIDDKNRKLVLLLLNTFIIGVLTTLYFLHLYFSTFNAAISEIQPKLTFAQLSLGYGIFFVVLLATIATLKKNTDKKLFMLFWVLISLALSYTPLGFARFYLRALFLPLAFLAIYLYREMLPYKNFKYLKYVVIVLFIMSAFPSTFLVFSKRIQETEQSNPWYYMPIEYKQSFDFINTLPKNGILASYLPGNVIPAYTGKKVYLGHTIQTPDFNTRTLLAADFYEGHFTEVEAYQFLKDNDIHYIYYSHFENTISNGFIKYPFLKKIFISDKVIIYELNESYHI